MSETKYKSAEENKTFVQIVKEKGVHWDDFAKEHKFAAIYIIEAAEDYHAQFKPSDEQIRELCTDPSGNVSMVEIEAMKKLRDQIFKP